MLKKFCLLVLVAGVLLQSCTSAGTARRARVSVDDITPLEIIKKNNAYTERLRYMKAVSTLTLESPKSSNQFSAQIAIRYPDSVYIKIEGILGVDGLKASLNKDTYVLYNIVNKYVIKGKTSTDAIRKTFDYDVSFEEMVELLMGLVPLKETELEQLTQFDVDSSYYVMNFNNGTGSKKIWIDPYADFAVSRINYYDASGELMLEKEFTRFEKINGFYFPRYVRVIRPKEKDLLSLYFDLRTINKSFSSSLFEIRYPKNIDLYTQ